MSSQSEPVETIVERAYFNVGNGGLTLSIVEVRKPDSDYRDFRFKHELSLFGQKAESSFPLGSSEIVSWMNMALQRVSMRVSGAMTERSYSPFEKPDVTHINGVEVQKLSSLVRIVAQFQRRAYEFSSPKELQNYLHEHPQADPSKHTVVKPGDKHGPSGEPKPKEHGHGHGHGDHGHGDHGKDAPKKSFKERMQALSEKAKSFVAKAPGEVKKFIEDDAHRRSVLQAVHKTIESLPAAAYKNAQHAIKHEVKEFHSASKGIHAVLKGGKMSTEQKHAVKSVCFDVALTVATVALSGGLAAGLKGLAAEAAASFAKSLAKKVALNSMTHGLGKAVAIEEFGHFGHGIMHVLENILTASEDGQGDEDKLIVAYVSKLVADELENLDPDTLAEAIEDASGSNQEGGS